MTADATGLIIQPETEFDPTPRARQWLRALHSLKPSLGYTALLVYNRTLMALRREWPGVTCFGAVVACRLEDLIQKSIFHFGVWEPEVTEILRARLQPGDLFIDVGANVGYFTLLGASLVGATGRVIGIEPSPSMFARLRSNVVRNGLQNVRLVAKAVAEGPGEVAMYLGPPDNLGETTTRARPSHRFEARVPTDSLIDILKPEAIKAARLVKIDVEGAELPILRDILAHLDAFGAQFEIVVEVEDDNAAEANDLFRAFIERGFALLSIPGVYRTVEFLASRPLESLKAVELPFDCGGNFLLARTSNVT